MKHLYTILASVFFFAPFLSAQITISQNEFQPIFTPGDSINILNCSDTSVDVGQTGGPNIYNLSSLQYSSGKAGVAMGLSIPLTAARFPNDTILAMGNQYTAWNFADGEWTMAGEVSVQSDTSYSVRVKRPGEVQFGFPMSYNNTWSCSCTFFDTTYVNGKVTNANSSLNPVTSIVDGYGTLILPGGDSVQCLRVDHSGGWFFLTQTGTFVLIFSNGMQPNTGVVRIQGMYIFEGKLPTPVRQEPPIAASFALKQNYPNPFNPSTIIKYQLPANSRVTLKVYDVLGREVTTLVDEIQSAGTHVVTFDGARFPSGVYFYRLETGTYHDVKKLLLLK